MNPKELSQLVQNNMKDKKRKNSGDEEKKKDTLKKEDRPILPQEPTVLPTLSKTKKYKYPIKSINEFIQKMLKKELATILSKTLS
jgi:hypothetical protein